MRAKSLGYEVIAFYVGLDSVDIAKKRIRQRVEKGGHFVPDDLVERRYVKSLSNIKKLIPIVDKCLVFDNTDSFVNFAIFDKGHIIYISKDDTPL